MCLLSLQHCVQLEQCEVQQLLGQLRNSEQQP
jgi:hypothetical protein